MPGDDAIGAKRCPDLAECVLLARKNAGEVHHLTQCDDVVPGHGLGDVLVGDAGAGVLDAEHRGDAGGRRHHGLERRVLGIFEHALDTLEAADVADLVGVGEDGRRAMGDYGAGVF